MAKQPAKKQPEAPKKRVVSRRQQKELLKRPVGMSKVTFRELAPYLAAGLNRN